MGDPRITEELIHGPEQILLETVAAVMRGQEGQHAYAELFWHAACVNICHKCSVADDPEAYALLRSAFELARHVARNILEGKPL